MNIFGYTLLIMGLMTVNYVCVFALATWAVINKYLLPVDYLEMLLLISQFLLLFKIYFDFISNIKGIDLSEIEYKFNFFYVTGGVFVALFAIAWFDMGIYMDIFNRGLNEKVYLQIYYLGYHILLGLFINNIITELIAYLAAAVALNAKNKN